MTFEDGPGAALSRNSEDLEARSYDFGRMVKHVPSAVARPESVGDVAALVRRAAADGFELAIRGGGHSQSGQSLTDGGVVLQTTRLDRVQPLDQELVRAQGGAHWRKVVDVLAGTRLLPSVLVDIGEATVGGTLAAGGVGTSSHRYGFQAGQVEQLEVVTGTGDRVLCSAARNKDLFDAVRGGQGQFGIITEAWIRLRPAKGRLRLYELCYRDFARFADDFERIVDEDRFDHLRADYRTREGQILLNAGIEYDQEPHDGSVLAGLGFEERGFTRDTASVGHAGMTPSWGFNWSQYHPWRDWIMPWQTLRTLIAESWLDPSWVPPRPWCWTGSYVIRTGAGDTPLVMCPPGDRAVTYSVLTSTPFTGFERAKALESGLREVDRTLVGLGGKSYLSGSVGYEREQWAEHYGQMLAKGICWKREFDPKQVFRRGGMPFVDSPAGSAGAGDDRGCHI